MLNLLIREFTFLVICPFWIGRSTMVLANKPIFRNPFGGAFQGHLLIRLFYPARDLLIKSTLISKLDRLKNFDQQVRVGGDQGCQRILIKHWYHIRSRFNFRFL